MSELIIINDIFDELKHENNRLLNDLIKCQKFYQLLEKYRKTIKLISNNCKCNENTNEMIFELLENEYKEIENNKSIETNIQQNQQTVIQNMFQIKNELIESHVNRELNENRNDYEITDNELSDENCDDFNETNSETNFENHNRFNTSNKTKSKTYKCDSIGCSFKTKSKVSFIQHKDTVCQTSQSSNPVIYKCRYYGCLFESNIKENLTNHKHIYAGKSFVCTYKGCELNFKTKGTMIRHRKLKHGYEKSDSVDFSYGETVDGLESNPNNKNSFDTKNSSNIEENSSIKLYKCDSNGCKFETNWLSNLSYHKRIHKGLKYRCYYTGCDRVFPILLYLKRHIVNKHKEKFDENKYTPEKSISKLKCDFEGCNFECNYTKSLKHHQHIHEGLPMTCQWPGCGRVFTVKSYLKNHVEYVHKGRVDKNLHKCDFIGCKFESIYKANLKSHKRLHESIKFTCDWPECGRAFQMSRYLKRHKLTHTEPDNRPFPCDWPGCEKACKTKSLLEIHSRTHTGEKPYKCDWNACERAFSQASELIMHKKRHNNIKDYLCDWPECGKRYNRLFQLKQHILCHQNKRQYNCNFNGCVQRFNTNTALRGHYMKVHMKKK